MTLKSDAKFEEKPICCSNNDKNLVNFDLSTQVSKSYTLIGHFCAKYITLDQKKYRGVMFHYTEESCKIWRKPDFWFGKWHEEFGKFSSEHLKVSNWYFQRILLYKVENIWAKNLQRSYVLWHWRIMKNLKRN